MTTQWRMKMISSKQQFYQVCVQDDNGQGTTCFTEYPRLQSLWVQFQVIEQWLCALSYGQQEDNRDLEDRCVAIKLSSCIKLSCKQSEALVKHSLLQQHLAGWTIVERVQPSKELDCVTQCYHQAYDRVNIYYTQSQHQCKWTYAAMRRKVQMGTTHLTFGLN
jgi:hypothetical protein